MELNIVGRNLGITDRFRAYAAEKSEKVTHLAERAISLDVKLSRHNEKNGNTGPDRVELTLVDVRGGTLVRVVESGPATGPVAHALPRMRALSYA